MRPPYGSARLKLRVGLLLRLLIRFMMISGYFFDKYDDFWLLIQTSAHSEPDKKTFRSLVPFTFCHILHVFNTYILGFTFCKYTQMLHAFHFA